MPRKKTEVADKPKLHDKRVSKRVPLTPEALQERNSLLARDELGQRQQVYKRYKENVNYTKVSGEDLEEAVTTVYYQRSSRGLTAMPIFDNGAQLMGAIDAYWEFMLESAETGHQIYPDIEGLASFIGISRMTMNRWLRGEANPEFVPILQQTYNDIAAVKKQLALKNKIPAIIAAMDFNNNHGYISQQTKVEVDVNALRQTPDQTSLIQNAKLLP